jgi:hypothetical protein
VVADQHQLAGAHAFVAAAGGVGLHQQLHAEGGQRAHRALHAVGFAGLVGVLAAGQHQHRAAADRAGAQHAGMAAHAQPREGRQVG